VLLKSDVRELRSAFIYFLSNDSTTVRIMDDGGFRVRFFLSGGGHTVTATAYGGLA